MKIQIIAFLLFLASCDGQSKKVSSESIKPVTEEMGEKPLDLELLRSIIDKQKNVETEENEPEQPYSLSKNDFEISNDIVANGLKKAGYKVILEEEFTKKLSEIFKISTKSNCGMILSVNDQITLFGNAMDGSKETRIKNQYDLYSDTQNLFIIPNRKFLTQMFLVKDLVKIDDQSFSVQLPQFVIARNKYLFNDSKADLVWLLSNDQAFLKRLVTDFGYDKEEKINKLVLENLYKEYSNPSHNITEKLGEVFFTKNCEGKLQIQQGLLDFVSQHTTKDDDRFIYALGNYLDYLFKDDKDSTFTESPGKKFTMEEKAKIVAYVANIESPAFYKFKPLNSPMAWHNAGTSLYNITAAHPEILKIMEKNNYYGLSSLKNIIESTEFEEEGSEN
ncbi:hypothetical protein ASG01_00405 [Chryseobacterium sp. Leaf180]|uniref:hypothetical protein n=1 Tax=Chryseobacterium sp. Leaf180 TaxID=1736289 RepID=UPI0006F30D23|nr:hypothetical protein [Chryseobacterium sp. Leaf180]KQR94385.1 hypothetical protein ASG01_00405 [Chryseobacterium sp. Leaf180]